VVLSCRGTRRGLQQTRKDASQLDMFGFLTPGTKEALDPLASPKAVAAWLRQLPALDVIGRQQQVMRAFEAMKGSRKPCDIARIQAIEYLDAALGADRRQLTKQYVENYNSAPKLAERIWQSIYDLSQGFIYAYQTALEEALQQSGNARWKPLVPLLFARLTHYYGTDAKLRVFRFERWIPGKWVELHRTYLRATELGVDREAATLGNGNQNATAWTIEQEYIYVLLIHQLNTGNMSPPQIDWATAQLRAWSRRLQIDAVPRSLEGFFVDIAGRAGLGRRTGSDSGSMLRYLDTTPLTEQLDRAIAALRQVEATDQGPAAHINQQRIGILEKVSPALAPNLNAELRRDRRVECAITATVRIGLSRICQELNLKDNGISLPEAGGPHEQIEVFAVADGSRAPRRVPDEHDSLVASLSSFSDPMWQVRDRSVAGLRIAASGGIGQSLSLGTLVAVRQSDVSGWVLGVVRRMNKVSTEEVEAGMSIIADRMVSVTLHAVRQPKDDMGFIVDGIDISTMGARFHGLYLPPPSRPDKPLSVKTLIIPTQEYSEGRNVILTTGRSVYTVALRHLVEQRAEWSWTAIQIIEKKSRV
jgi:cyclic-di-GMP-binding protein